MKGDTRSLDYSSFGLERPQQNRGLSREPELNILFRKTLSGLLNGLWGSAVSTFVNV